MKKEIKYSIKPIVIIVLFVCLCHSHVAEWLGVGLQNLLRRFESALDVDKFNWLCYLV